MFAVVSTTAGTEPRKLRFARRTVLLPGFVRLLVARGDRGEGPAFGDLEQSAAEFGEVGLVGAKRPLVRPTGFRRKRHRPRSTEGWRGAWSSLFTVTRPQRSLRVR